MPARCVRSFVAVATASCLGLSGSPAGAAAPAPIQLTRFVGASAFATGSFTTTSTDADRLILAPGALSGAWTSPTVQPHDSFTRLVASWNAETPADGRVRIEAQATT